MYQTIMITISVVFAIAGAIWLAYDSVKAFQNRRAERRIATYGRHSVLPGTSRPTVATFAGAYA